MTQCLNLQYLHPTFSQEIAPGQEIELIIKAKFERMPYFVLHLFTEQAGHLHNHHHIAFIAFYHGVILALAIYSLFFYSRLKEPSSLYYCAFLLSLLAGVSFANGFWTAFIPKFGNFHAENYVAAMIFLVPITGALFTLNFLQIKRILPKFFDIARKFCFIMGFEWLYFLVYPSPIQMSLLDVNNMLVLAFSIFCSAVALKRGYKPAKYFLAAWIVFLLSGVIWTFSNYGLLPINFLTYNAPMLGNMLESILMSLALSAKVRINRESELQALLKEKENQSLRILLRNLIHDISNPVTSLNYAVGILSSSNKQIPNEKILKILAASSQSLVDFIGHIRKMESIQSGKTHMDISPVVLNDVVENSVFLFEHRFNDKGVHLTHVLHGQLRVLAEKVSLQTDVLDNLLSNALKFSSSGDTVIIEGRKIGDQVVLTIQDTGVGMSSNLVDTVFDASVKTSRVGTANEKGTGYGLPLVKCYIERYGATIEVDSKEKEEDDNAHAKPSQRGNLTHGTIFTIRFKSAE